MKTLYLTQSSANIFVDPEENTVGTLQTEDRYDIRAIYYMEEPMHVVYEFGERKEEIDAKKGDILLVFYNSKYNKYILDTVKSKQWSANIKNRHKMEQKAKEEWAAKQAEGETPCCDCCDECKGAA
jgi:hypothetical protein